MFKEELINSWQDFIKYVTKFKGGWVFRGQAFDYPLKTTLERACDDYDISLKNVDRVEALLIRDFRRRYKGDDRDSVLNDTLYCLALMQHHGAPTRLLDWTYSPYVAAFFALQKALSTKSIVWCLSENWCFEQAMSIAGKRIINARNIDNTRNDKTFCPLYMKKKPNNFVFLENPFLFNPRLNIQQGCFLCPGNVSAEFEKNLRSMQGWNKKGSILKLKFQMNKQRHLDALVELNLMNVSNAVLFPGLDGFSQSLKQKLPNYEKMAKKLNGRMP